MHRFFLSLRSAYFTQNTARCGVLSSGRRPRRACAYILVQMSKAESKGTGVRDVAAAKFVAAYAAHLKKSGKVELPKWVDLVKTGTFQELAPYDQDWFFVRAASIARKIYLRGGIGIGRLKRMYGGSKRNAPSASHFATGSGSVARHAVHALEKLGVIEKDKNGYVLSLQFTICLPVLIPLSFSGRKITSAGQRDLDRIARSVSVA